MARRGTARLVAARRGRAGLGRARDHDRDRLACPVQASRLCPMSTQPQAPWPPEALQPVQLQELPPEIPDLTDPNITGPIPFKIAGHTYYGRAVLSLRTMRDVVRLARVGTDDLDAMITNVEQLLPKILTKESGAQFLDAMDDDERPLGPMEIVRTIALLVKTYTGRPTQAQSLSSDGPSTTGPTLTEPALSTESIPDSSPFPG